MADQQEWPADRLRALDRAVAEARGWTWVGERCPDPDVLDYVWLGWRKPDGTASTLKPVSKGCAETFELMEELEGRVCRSISRFAAASAGKTPPSRP